MFKKVVFSIVIILISFLTGYATAQSFFNTPPAKTPAAGARNQNVMSPSDFQSQTQQLEQQKKEALSNQMKENLSKVPPPVLPAAPTPTAPPESSEAPKEGTTETTAPAASATPPAAPATGEQPATTATAPTTPTAVKPAQPAQQQTNVYTGFGQPGQEQTPKQQSAPSSGGWNIKY